MIVLAPGRSAPGHFSLHGYYAWGGAEGVSARPCHTPRSKRGVWGLESYEVSSDKR